MIDLGMDKLWLADADLDGIEVSLTFSAADVREAELICDERDWILLGEHVDIELSDAMISLIEGPRIVH